jgi:hypothetical protein
MATVVRTIVVVLSYLAASLGAGCVLALWIAVLLFQDVAPHKTDVNDMKLLMLMPVVMSESAAVLGLLPAIPAIIYSERKSVRSLWFYLYGGALVGIASYLLYLGILVSPEPGEALSVLRHSMSFPAWGMWLAVSLSGFFGGFVYWLARGRRAGVRTIS